MILAKTEDPMGAAISDYYRTGRAARLRVLSSMFDEDEIPVPHLFRGESEMPPLEAKALSMARGRVLDVGAGAGCHSLILEKRGLEVTAIDVSPLSCEVMAERGVGKVICGDVMDADLEGQYDTILLLMNGIGMAGRVEGLGRLLERLKSMLAPGGQILTDSSDLRYVFEDEDGNFEPDPEEEYYGEVDFRMVYKSVRGRKFDWLYVDSDLLRSVADKCGLKFECVAKGEHYDYLARMVAGK